MEKNEEEFPLTQCIDPAVAVELIRRARAEEEESQDDQTTG